MSRGGAEALRAKRQRRLERDALRRERAQLGRALEYLQVKITRGRASDTGTLEGPRVYVRGGEVTDEAEKRAIVARVMRFNEIDGILNQGGTR